jgi:hypothetical protein
LNEDTKDLMGLGIVAINMISDIYFRAKEAGVEITPENIRDHISVLEAKADANDKEMGITG